MYMFWHTSVHPFLPFIPCPPNSFYSPLRPPPRLHRPSWTWVLLFCATTTPPTSGNTAPRIWRVSRRASTPPTRSSAPPREVGIRSSTTWHSGSATPSWKWVINQNLPVRLGALKLKIYEMCGIHTARQKVIWRDLEWTLSFEKGIYQKPRLSLEVTPVIRLDRFMSYKTFMILSYFPFILCLISPFP